MSPLRRHALFGLFIAASILVFFKPVWALAALAMDYNESHLSHVGLIPLMSAALIFWNRKKIFLDLRPSVIPAAAAFLTAGALSYLGWTYQTSGAASNYLAAMTAALAFFWYGGFLLFYGAQAFKAALFPLLFLGMMIPMPNGVLAAFVRMLQVGSAEMVSILFAVTGTPAYRATDVVFALPNLSIEVAEACSGIRSTLVMIIITLLAAYLSLKSNWKRTALLAVVIPISLFKNAVRIVTLTLLAIHYDMGFITGSLHHDGGVVFMAAGLVLIYPVLALLVRSEDKKKLIEAGVRS